MAQREEPGSEVRRAVDLFKASLLRLSEVAALEYPYTEALVQSKTYVLEALETLTNTFDQQMPGRIAALEPDQLQALDETLRELGVSSLLQSASVVAFSPADRAMARSVSAREETGGVKDFIKEILEEVLHLLPISPGLGKMLTFVLKLINKLQGKFG